MKQCSNISIPFISRCFLIKRNKTPKWKGMPRHLLICRKITSMAFNQLDEMKYGIEYVQASRGPESKRPESRRPDHSSRVQLFRHARISCSVKIKLEIQKKSTKEPWKKTVRRLSCIFDIYWIGEGWNIEMSWKSRSSNKLDLVTEKLKKLTTMKRLCLMKNWKIEKLEKK